MAIAWVLNLDADLELGARGRYAPTRSVLAAMRPHVERLARALLADGDALVDDASAADSARGLPGRAFCPTPRALSLLRHAGAIPEPHPPLEVLRRVNGRAFCASLGPTLPGAAFVEDLEVARAMLASPPPIAYAWRIKPAFGMSGRGQRVLAPGDDLGFLGGLLARGGVMIEPNVAIETEWARHGMLAVDGAATFGALVRQRCDPHGQWVATERVVDAPPDVAAAIDDEVRRVAGALHAAGYFGPFGVDAFTYRDGPTVRLQPRSEINARYSMGFAVGFGLESRV